MNFRPMLLSFEQFSTNTEFYTDYNFFESSSCFQKYNYTGTILCYLGDLGGWISKAGIKSCLYRRVNFFFQEIA